MPSNADFTFRHETGRRVGLFCRRALSRGDVSWCVYAGDARDPVIVAADSLADAHEAVRDVYKDPRHELRLTSYGRQRLLAGEPGSRKRQSAGEPRVRVRLDLRPEVAEWLKARAKAGRMTMAALVEQTVNEHAERAELGEEAS